MKSSTVYYQRKQLLFGLLPLKVKKVTPQKKNGAAVVTNRKTRKARTRRAREEEKAEEREANKKVASPRQRARKQ